MATSVAPVLVSGVSKNGTAPGYYFMSPNGLMSFPMAPTECFLWRCQVMLSIYGNSPFFKWGDNLASNFLSVVVSTTSVAIFDNSTQLASTTLPPTDAPANVYLTVYIRVRPGACSVFFAGPDPVNPTARLLDVAIPNTGGRFTGGSFWIGNTGAASTLLCNTSIEPIFNVSQSTECARALRAKAVFAGTLVGNLDWANVTSKPALVDQVTSTNTTLAATANSVRTVYDACVKKTGDTVTGPLTVTGAISEGGSTLATKYAAVGHIHDATNDLRYANISHTHIGLAPGPHTHSWTDVTGTNLVLGNIAGSGASGAFGLAHANCAANQTAYALMQAGDGTTLVNAPANKPLLLMNNNVEVARVTNGGLSVTGSISEGGSALSSKYFKCGPDSSESDRMMVKKLNMYTNRPVEFGYAYPDKEVNAGKIGYQTFDSFFDIVGANQGAAGTGTRYVKVYDYLYVSGTGYSSDRRLKKNVMPLGRMLDRLDAIEGKTFEWDPTAANTNKRPAGKRVGLMAQDLQTLCPEVVHETEDGLAYDQPALNGVLIQLIKDLRAEVTELKSKPASSRP